MSDLVGNPEDRFSRVAAQYHFRPEQRKRVLRVMQLQPSTKIFQFVLYVEREPKILSACADKQDNPRTCLFCSDIHIMQKCFLMTDLVQNVVKILSGTVIFVINFILFHLEPNYANVRQLFRLTRNSVYCKSDCFTS